MLNVVSMALYNLFLSVCLHKAIANLCFLINIWICQHNILYILQQPPYPYQTAQFLVLLYLALK